jgi:hypothetical protein
MAPKKEDLIPHINNRKEAAKFFDVTEKTIVNWMKKYDLYSPKDNFGCNKLNFEKALKIRELYKNGAKIKDLSKSYNVTFATISRIIHNLIYKDNTKTNIALVNVVYNTNAPSENSLSDLSAANGPVDEHL